MQKNYATNVANAWRQRGLRCEKNHQWLSRKEPKSSCRAKKIEFRNLSRKALPVTWNKTVSSVLKQTVRWSSGVLPTLRSPCWTEPAGREMRPFCLQSRRHRWKTAGFNFGGLPSDLLNGYVTRSNWTLALSILHTQVKHQGAFFLLDPWLFLPICSSLP